MTHTRYAFVKANWHADIVDQALIGFLKLMPAEQVDVFEVPGAFEIPGAIVQVQKHHSPHAIVAIGAVIRGETPHFDFIAGESARVIAEISRNSDIPIINGIITTDTAQHAFDRSQPEGKNKGWEAMEAALQTISVYDSMRTASTC